MRAKLLSHRILCLIWVFSLSLLKTGIAQAEYILPATDPIYTYNLAKSPADWCNEYPYLASQNFLTPPPAIWAARLDWKHRFSPHCGAYSVDNITAQHQLQDLNYKLNYQQYLTYKKNQGMLLAASLPATPQIINSRQQSFNDAYRVLSVFVQKYPELTQSIESAAGFAVFEATSFNALLYAGGWGSGVVFDKVNKNTIYVGTFRAGTGLGLGYINEYVLIIFRKHFSIEQYFGNIVGGDVGASATVGLWSKSLSFNPTISTYRIYNYGADIQGNWGASLYWVMPFIN